MSQVSDEKFHHHVFAGDIYCGFTTGRFDSIMVEVDKSEAFAHGNGRKLFFWFTKVLTSVSIIRRRVISVKCGIHNRVFCSYCGQNFKDEIAFLLWHEVLDNENFPLDGMDNNLHCVSLKWQQTCWNPGNNRWAAEYVLVPLSLVRELLHIVRGYIRGW